MPTHIDSQRKKILYLITKSNWGGAQRYVYDLATHLNREQFEPVVALGGTGVLKEQLEHAGIRTIVIDSLERDISLRKEWAFATELWRILRTERPEILHVNSSKAGGVGTLLGRFARVPRIVFTAHGWAFNEDRPWWQRVIIKLMHWLTVLFSHVTIAVSTAMKQQMDLPCAQRKIRVLNPGRTIGAMYGKREAREHIAERDARLRSHLRDPWILCIGELHPIKRFGVLLESLARVRDAHPNVRCIIIGDGELRAVLAHQISDRALENHTFLVGSITEAARFLKAGNLFVLPSKSESYGYVLHEAGLAGLPVVATNVGGIPDIVSDRSSGRLVEPDDAAALAAAITDYFDRPQQWRQYAETLKVAMEARSIDTMVEQTTPLYLLSLR